MKVNTSLSKVNPFDPNVRPQATVHQHEPLQARLLRLRSLPLLQQPPLLKPGEVICIEESQAQQSADTVVEDGGAMQPTPDDGYGAGEAPCMAEPVGIVLEEHALETAELAVEDAQVDHGFAVEATTEVAALFDHSFVVDAAVEEQELEVALAEAAYEDTQGERAADAGTCQNEPLLHELSVGAGEDSQNERLLDVDCRPAKALRLSLTQCVEACEQ